MKSTNTIVVIGAYFGKFNNYFPLWLKSCAANPKVDFMIFNDCAPVENVPRNVTMVPFSLKQMKALAIVKTGIENLSLEQPYKCCDFKPLYGEIFQDYISEYEYWGHCDFDLVFGDIYGMLERYDYKKYDKFLHLGHLSFYRNTAEVNHYYTKDGAAHHYTKALTSPKGWAFDEYNNLCQIYLKNNLPLFYKRIYADITPMYERFRLSEECHVDEKDKNYKYQIFYWEDGKTYRSYLNKGSWYKEEFMYVHFQKRPNFTIPFDVDTIKSFYITPTGFVPKEGEVTLEIVKRLNAPDYINEWWRHFCRGVRYYKRAIISKTMEAWK